MDKKKVGSEKDGQVLVNKVAEFEVGTFALETFQFVMKIVSRVTLTLTLPLFEIDKFRSRQTRCTSCHN